MSERKPNYEEVEEIAILLAEALEELGFTQKEIEERLKAFWKRQEV